MSTFVVVLLSLLAGGVFGYWMAHRQVSAMRGSNAELEKRLERAEAEKRMQQEANAREREQGERMLAQLRDSFRAERETLRMEFVQLAEKTTKSGTGELKAGNAEQMRALFAPVKEELERVARSIQDARLSSTEQKTALEKTIESMMRQTQQIGHEAEQLTQALRAGGKVQGDWGEQLLESILENSGLRRGEEFVVQAAATDAEGNRLRPDVVVNCPGGRKIVIDSKVSLTAYAAYVAAETEAELHRLERENLQSVRKHVDELAAKNYDRLFSGTLSHVLMFVPNEGSYVLALRSDPQLGTYAFRKNVLIINPTNLMMALQLIYNLWQSERQARNIEEIVHKSSDLYDKFVGFIDKFDKVDAALQNAQRCFNEARGQLHTGNGNIVRRLEALKKMGITPKKSIPAELIGEEDGTEDGLLPKGGGQGAAKSIDNGEHP